MKKVYIRTLIYILLSTLSPLLKTNPPHLPPNELLQFHIGKKLSGTFTFTNQPAAVITRPLTRGELVCVNQKNILSYALIHDTFKDQSYSVITSLKSGGRIEQFHIHEIIRFAHPLVLKDMALIEQYLNK
jgi:hypothetical protein